MTEATHARADRASRIALVLRHPAALWTAFAALHLWLGYLNFFPYLSRLGDVTSVYPSWAEQALVHHSVVGIDLPFVYPIGALVPILASAAFGLPAYTSTWMILVTAVNAGAFAFMLGRSSGTHSRRVPVGTAWWWLVFMAVLGPITLGRIDAFTIPFALVGLLLAVHRPAVASLLITIATWIKVWPAVLLVAVLLQTRHRARVVITAALASAAVAGVVLLLGGGANVLSFVSQQTGRGLQIEAPITTVWMWQAFAGVSGVEVYFDFDILTYQVTGAGTEVAATLMTPLLVLVVALVCALGYAVMRRADPGAPVPPILAPLSLALVVALLAFNKVGSPQFVLWLAVPIVVGLATQRASGQSFGFPSSIVLVIGALTQLIYPAFYEQVLTLDPVMLVVLTVRNILLFVLLGWALAVLVRLVRGGKLDARTTVPRSTSIPLE